MVMLAKVFFRDLVSQKVAYILVNHSSKGLITNGREESRRRVLVEGSRKNGGIKDGD